MANFPFSGDSSASLDLSEYAEQDKCANCSFNFSTSSARTKSSEIVIESAGQLTGAGASNNKVSPADAFAFVYNLRTCVGGGLAVCSECASPLSKAYAEVKKLSQFRAPDSFFSRQLLDQNFGVSKASKKKGKAKSSKSKPKKSPAIKKPSPKIPKEKTVRSKAAKKTYNDVEPALPPVVPFFSEINGAFESTRPSRSAKLTAMVLMNNSWDKEPLPERSGERKSSRITAPTKQQAAAPAVTSAPTKVQTVKEVKDPEKVEKPASKKRSKAAEAPAATQNNNNKRIKLAPIEEVTPPSGASAPTNKNSKKKSKATTNVSKATSISPPANDAFKALLAKHGQLDSPQVDKAENTNNKKANAKLDSSKSPHLAALEELSKKTKKNAKSAASVATDSSIASNAIASPSPILPPEKKPKKEKGDSKSRKKTKVLLPKVFKKSLENAMEAAAVVDNKQDNVTKLEGKKTKAETTKGKRGKGQPAVVPSEEAALDLTWSPVAAEKLQDKKGKKAKVTLPKTVEKPDNVAKKRNNKKKTVLDIPDPKGQMVAKVNQEKATKSIVDNKNAKSNQSAKVAKPNQQEKGKPTQQEKGKLNQQEKGKINQQEKGKLNQQEKGKPNQQEKGKSNQQKVNASPEKKETKSDSKKFLCTLCSKNFSARWNLRRHELLVHELGTVNPPYTCPNCSLVFDNKNDIFEHRMSGPCAISSTSSPTSSAPAKKDSPPVSAAPAKKPVEVKKIPDNNLPPAANVLDEAAKEKKPRKRKSDSPIQSILKLSKQDTIPATKSAADSITSSQVEEKKQLKVDSPVKAPDSAQPVPSLGQSSGKGSSDQSVKKATTSSPVNNNIMVTSSNNKGSSNSSSTTSVSSKEPLSQKSDEIEKDNNNKKAASPAVPVPTTATSTVASNTAVASASTASTSTGSTTSTSSSSNPATAASSVTPAENCNGAGVGA